MLPGFIFKLPVNQIGNKGHTYNFFTFWMINVIPNFGTSYYSGCIADIQKGLLVMNDNQKLGNMEQIYCLLVLQLGAFVINVFCTSIRDQSCLNMAKMGH